MIDHDRCGTKIDYCCGARGGDNCCSERGRRADRWARRRLNNSDLHVHNGRGIAMGLRLGPLEPLCQTRRLPWLRYTAMLQSRNLEAEGVNNNNNTGEVVSTSQ